MRFCYQLKSVYSKGSTRCQNCPHFADCQVQETTSCKRAACSKPDSKLTPLEAAKLKKMSKKAAAIAELIFHNKMDVSRVIKNGERPFKKNACEFLNEPIALLSISGEFCKSELNQRLKQKYPNQTPASIKSKVSIACSLLTGLGVAVEHGKLIKLRT